MVGNELEIEIIELFRQDITRFLSIHQISKKLNRTYPYIYKKVLTFIREGIFKTTKIGSSILCSINLQSEEAIILLIINEIHHKKKYFEKNPKLKETISKLKEIGREILIHTALKTKKQTILVVENQLQCKALKKEFTKELILTKEEFQTLVLEDYNEIQDHILLYHNEKYYEIIGEIEQELKIRNSPMKH